MSLLSSLLKPPRLLPSSITPNLPTSNRLSTALIFDTETTGLPSLKLPPSAPGQPHLAQLAAVLVDTESWEVRSKFSLLVALPPSASMHSKAQEVHGLTPSLLSRNGVSPAVAASLFTALIEAADVLVAHNAPFDTHILSSTYHRLNLPFNPAAVPTLCTMSATTPLLAIPGRFKGSFKWPSLAEAHGHYGFGDIEGAHDAMVDVEACGRVFRRLVEEGEVAVVERERGGDGEPTTTVVSLPTILTPYQPNYQPKVQELREMCESLGIAATGGKRALTKRTEWAYARDEVREAEKAAEGGEAGETADLSAVKVPELREMCRDRDVSAAGNRNDLVARLSPALLAEETGESADRADREAAFLTRVADGSLLSEKFHDDEGGYRNGIIETFVEGAMADGLFMELSFGGEGTYPNRAFFRQHGGVWNKGKKEWRFSGGGEGLAAVLEFLDGFELAGVADCMGMDGEITDTMSLDCMFDEEG